jgi:6-phosphogluconate dehydrogenase
MVHNGIEYGLLQAYAEGFALMNKADEFDLDLHQIAEIWRYGSVVRSWLLDLAALALENQEEFSKIRGFVEDSGEGRWTIDEAIARGVSTPVMAISLFERFQSRERDSFAAKIIAALRNQFGGHKFFEESAGAEAN